MICTDFVKDTILAMSDKSFDSLKDSLEKYKILFHDDDKHSANLPLFVSNKRDVSKRMLAEKVCDYYERLRVCETNSKSFKKVLKLYYSDLEDVVSSKIVETSKPGNSSQEALLIPRARKYYEKAVQMREDKNITTSAFIEYTRIILCLYAEICQQKKKLISDFNYSSTCILPQEILSSLEQEKALNRFFDIETDWNSRRRSTLTLLIISLYSIIDNTIEGEYYNA